MAIYKTTISMPWQIPVQGPQSTNTVHVDIPGAVELDRAAVASVILDFYEGLSFWSYVFAGVINLDMYDVADALPRTSVYSESRSFTPGTTSLPGEVTMRAEYRAEYEPNTHRGRGRGRLSFGPIEQAALDELGVFTEASVTELYDGMNGVLTALGVLGATLVTGSEQYWFNPATKLRVGNEAGTLRSRQYLPTIQLGSL